MDGTFGGGDLISASLAIMLGGTDAELHDKEISLSTSQITGSQTAIFEYDPQNEPVSGDPPGPWDGYSLFTIDLSGVKDDIEDLQQQVSDLEDELEEMQECCDEVVDIIHDYDPTYDPHPDPPDPTNPTIPEKIQEIIDEESGFDPPVGTPIEDVLKIMGIGDTVEIEDNDYYFAVYAEGWYRSFNPSAYPQIDIKENSFYTATTPPNYDYGSLGWVIYVYSKATKELVTSVQFGTFQGFDAGEYVKLISCTINYTTKTMDGVYETDDPYPHTPIQIAVSADLTRYITTTSPNPQYKVKNS